MREQGAAAGRHFGGPSPARRGGGMGGAGSESPFEGVRMNLFDVFRFGSGERENLGIPKARCVAPEGNGIQMSRMSGR